jgi:hypothetical protein
LFHGPIIGLYTDIGYKFETGYEVDKFDGCDLVLCGDIHRRQTIYLEREIEIDEEDLDFYLKKGWEIS